MNEVNRETALPALRRRRRRDWGRIVARAIAVVLAIVGLLPFALGAIVRTEWARTRVSSETTALLASQGIHAKYGVELQLWPLSLDVKDVAVDATDGGSPALVAQRLSVRPRIFALLGGKFAIDQVEIIAPEVRLVVRDGEITNLALPKSQKKSDGPLHVDFELVSLSDAKIDVDLDGTRIRADGVDADVSAEDDRRVGTTFEIAFDLTQAIVERSRPPWPRPGNESGPPARDEDVVCQVEGRVKFGPAGLVVHRLTALARADLDPGVTSDLRCESTADDPRRVELSLAHFNVEFPEREGMHPKVRGHVAARMPIALAMRFADTPDLDGTIRVDGEIRYAEDTVVPDFTGRLEAHGVRVDTFRFADLVESELFVQGNVVKSSRTHVTIAKGDVEVKDLEVEPLAKGIPIQAKVEIRGLDFTALMATLGVARHPHVAWDVRALHLPEVKGTLSPLHLDADFTGHTENFLVANKAIDDPARERIIGVKEAEIAAHLAVRPDAVHFKNVRAVLPNTVLEDGAVSLFYRSYLTVDVGHGHIDLRDVTPIGSVPMLGVADVEVHVAGPFGIPRLEADAEVKDFVLGDLPFGNVNRVHAVFTGTTLELRDLKAQKGSSVYEVPTARLAFGKAAGVQVDAVANAPAFAIRDLLAMFRLEEDPRFAELDGRLGTRAEVHVALGGPEDVCGGGFIEVRADARLRDMNLYGEKFEDGDASMNLRWYDRLAGIEGADIEVRSFSLRKIRAKNGARALGSVLGSATIARGGALTANAVIDGIPISRIDMASSLQKSVEGSVSGVARVSGRVDEWTVQSDVDVTPVRVRGIPFGSSHLSVEMTETPKPKRVVGKTRCGAPIGAPFDPVAYADDTSSHGEIRATGDLLAGQLHLEDVRMTRQKAASVTGKVVLQKFDLAGISRFVLQSTAEPTTEESLAPEIRGELSGVLTIEELRTDDLPHASVRFVPAGLTIRRAKDAVSMRPTLSAIKFSHDVLSLPTLTFDLEAANGLKGAATVSGNVIQVSRDAELDLGIELTPIDLAILTSVVPKVERSRGVLSGALKLTGRAKAPSVDGELRVRNAEFDVKGLPSAITDVELDVRATESEVRVTRGNARFAGGTIAVAGVVPLRGIRFDAAALDVSARDIHLVPAEGVQATLDSDLTIAFDGSQLPRVTGEVLVTGASYTRAVNLVTDLTGFKVGARRTVVDTYDPTLDFIALDLNVRARTPIKIRNNLVDVQLQVDPGGVAVTGTNQRIGLRGTLRAMPGGHFRFRTTEFDIRQASIRFDDATRIAPEVDVLASTEYRRAVDSSAGGAGAVSTRSGSLFRISLHAYGDAENLRIDLTSDPALSQDDIALLLSIGMTRAELYQLQAGSVGASIALEALATASGADSAVKTVIPVIDDFRFGSAYSPRVGRTVPQLTVGKRLTDDVRANVTTGLAEDRELRANIEWRLSQRVSVQGSYDNVNTISAAGIGNLGADFRWRLEFE
ncbi:MAG: translocation/assembly module TamB [Polyangiaceae bacterium]